MKIRAHVTVAFEASSYAEAGAALDRLEQAAEEAVSATTAHIAGVARDDCPGDGDIEF